MPHPTNGAGVDTPDATSAVAQSRMGATALHARAPRLGRGREGVDFVIGDGVARAALGRAYERAPGDPVYRQLKIYALDPSASRRDGAIALVNVPYEHLEPGPRGKVLEVINDAVGGDAQLDLDEHVLLLGQGRAPSPSDSLFRSQMVYAVCTTTYAAFRQALGRDIAWGFTRRGPDGCGNRLVVRPSASGLRNAYYDRHRGELCFGVYEANTKVAGRNLPGGEVSSCLSHDVVVHEMAHAIVDGLRSEFMTPSNPDVLAFHEAFADLIAIFQRFTYRDVVRRAICGARGDVRSATMLTSIAQQFGQTTGLTGALRNAVGGTPRMYGDSTEPHERGEVLLAAVFEAFATVYEQKTRPLVKLATGGSGVLPPGDISDDLADSLTKSACKLASQFLSVCIRAIDYCPPVDITFGEYLRAVITADFDLVPDDAWNYREAWIDGFRKYAVYPAEVSNLSEDALRWRPSDIPVPAEPELGFDRLQFAGDPGRPANAAELTRQARALGALVADPQYAPAFGLCPEREIEGDQVDLPMIHSIRTARRAGPDGQVAFDLVAEITQRREVRTHAGITGFDFFGGATVILDPNGSVRYVIRKSLSSKERLQRQRDVLSQDTQFWGLGPGARMYPEPNVFRMLHSASLDESR